MMKEVGEKYFLSKFLKKKINFSSQEKGQVRRICRMSLRKNPTKSSKIGTLESPDFLEKIIS